MRVLIACGRGMKAISGEMNRRFKNGTIKFDYLKSMEEVNDFLASNLGIERIIITSESFTSSKEVKEDELREQLIRLSATLSDYNTTVVFVVSLDEFGPVIDEELFNYGDRIRIIKHSSAYTVKLFERLTLTDINKIENNYVAQSLTSVEDVTSVEVDSEEDDIFQSEEEEESYFEEEEEDYFELEDEEDDYFSSGEEEEDNEFELGDTVNSEGITFKQEGSYGDTYNPSFESSATYNININTEEETHTDSVQVEETQNIEIEEEIEDETQDVDGIDDFNKLYNIEQEDLNIEESTLQEDTENVEVVEIEEIEDESLENQQETTIEFEEDIESVDKPENQEDSTVNNDDIFGVFSEDIYGDREEEVIEEEFKKEEVKEESVTVEPVQTQDKPKKKGFLSSIFDKFGKKEREETHTELPEVSSIPVNETKEEVVTYEEEYGNTQDDLVTSLDGENDFSDDIYSNHNGTALDIREAMTQKEYNDITELLGKLSNRHASYVFTGTRNSGVTSIAYNVSAVLSNIGFSVLYVDCDTEYRPLSYITKDLFNMVHINEETSSSYLKAIGSPINIENYVHIVMPGLHTITMGLEQDTTHIGRIVDKQKFRRFSGMVRDRYDFIIYDMPFEFLMTVGLETAFVSDSIITVTESNTKGLMELLVKFGTIENEDARTLMFSKASILMNKYTKNTTYFGKRFKKQESVLEQLDNIAEEITGAEADFRFVNMKCIGVCPYIEMMDNCWFTNNIAVADKTIKQHILNIIRGMVGGM